MEYVQKWIENLGSLFSLESLSETQKNYIKSTINADYYNKRITWNQHCKLIDYIDSLT